MDVSTITVKPENPNSQDANMLMEELSNILESITGSSGKNSFRLEDVNVPRAIFAIAHEKSGIPIGCGALRPINEETAELKRMYTRVKAKGVGTKILQYLEQKAIEMDYKKIWLETRLINERAVRFYEGQGYYRIPNYGKYTDKEESVCFEKILKEGIE